MWEKGYEGAPAFGMRGGWLEIWGVDISETQAHISLIL